MLPSPRIHKLRLIARRLPSNVLCSLFCFWLALAPSLMDLRAAAPHIPQHPSPQLTNALTLREFLRLVIERNESLHARILEFEIAHKRLDAERGIFEPELTLGYDRVENERENTAEQRRSSGVLVF